MTLNANNIFSKFIAFHPSVDLIKNIYVDDKDALRFGINKSSVVFKLKDDTDVFVLTPFLDDTAGATSILRITNAKNHLLVDDGDWMDDFTITAVDWIGLSDDITTIPDKLRPFLNDVIKFFDDDDDFVDINIVNHNIKVDFKTPV